MARHQRFTLGIGVDVFFAVTRSLWERGANENTNPLFRHYLPKGTPITSHQPYLGAIVNELNNCPRRTLDYRTPTKGLTSSLLSRIDTALISSNGKV